jgi:aminopeptidase N
LENLQEPDEDAWDFTKELPNLYNGKFLRIPAKYLYNKNGNDLFRIHVEVDNVYRNDGTGLHSFDDPVDDHLYMYTQCEAFNCNRWFPCFDQPNLKGTLLLTVEAPPTWTIIANE